MRNCVEGHEMQEDHKRCGSCGGEPKAGGDMAKCSDAGCGVEQSASHAFCVGCGGVMAKADDIVFQELEAFWRERQSDSGEFVVEEGDHSAVKDVLKAADAAAQAGEVYDAGPLIKADIEAQHQTYDAIMTLGRRQVAVERGQVLIARGLTHLRDMLKARDLGESAQRNKPARARAAAHVTQLERRGPADPNADESAQIYEVLKAGDLVDMELNGQIGSGDSTRVQFYAERGATFGNLAEEDPELAERLSTGIARRAAA